MKLLVNGKEHEFSQTPEVQITEVGGKLLVRTAEGTFSALAIKQGSKTLVSYRGRTFTLEKPKPISQGSHSHEGQGEFHAQMPGQVVEVLVEQGQQVQKGQKLLVLEAMKTHQPVLAGIDGVVAELNVSPGQQVSEGMLIIRLQPKG